MDLVSKTASAKPALVQEQLISIYWHLFLHTTLISSQLLSSTFLCIARTCASLIHPDSSFSFLLAFPLSTPQCYTNDHNTLKLLYNNICRITKYFSPATIICPISLISVALIRLQGFLEQLCSPQWVLYQGKKLLSLWQTKEPLIWVP